MRDEQFVFCSKGCFFMRRNISGGVSRGFNRSKDLVHVWVKSGVRDEIRKEARARGLTMGEYVEYLTEFEKLERIDDLISKLRKLETEGFSLKQVVHLSVLYTLLKRLSNEYDL